VSQAAKVGVAGFCLIAATYGLARYAYGLFLPALRRDLGMSESLAGFVASGSYLAYCAAILVSAWGTKRFGARVVVGAAGAAATLGMAGLALATTAEAAAVAVLTAGLSTGLASPPLASAVAHSASPRQRGFWNGVINSGTSAGVLLSGPVALTLATQWREAYAAFAALAAATTILACMATPSAAGLDRAAATLEHARLPRPLLSAAFTTGFASAAIWTFGGEALASAGWDATTISGVWVVIGAAGLIGAGAGRLVDHAGLLGAHAIAVGALATATLLFAVAPHPGWTVWLAAALFGAAYIIVSGVYLIWAVNSAPAQAAGVLATAFLTLSLGQAAGAATFGIAAAASSLKAATAVFALVGALAIGLQGRRPDEDDAHRVKTWSRCASQQDHSRPPRTRAPSSATDCKDRT
jgi:predicted MFS family arabinose efflux permease